MTAIYISSPYRADDDQTLQENINLARRACEYAIKSGDTPICPQLYYPQFLDEGTQRDIALKAGLGLVKAADELWVIGPKISSGMASEIKEAARLGVPVRCVTDPQVAMEHLLDAIFKE